MPRRTAAASGAAIDAALDAYRERIRKRHRVRNADALVELVNGFGFCFAFTHRTGDAALPACFDHLSTNDEGRKWGWMWTWKDELAEEKRIYYGTLLVRKPTFVSLRLLPLFYATFGRAGEPDDHLEDVRAGRLSEIARRVIEFLAQRGETQTKRMRAELGISSKEGRTQYGKAIDDLQRLMYLARVRAVGEGREDYNYTYDLFVRRYPEVARASERIASGEARTKLLARALELAGGVTVGQLRRLFEWDEDALARTIERAERSRTLVRRGSGRDELLLLAEVAGTAS